VGSAKAAIYPRPTGQPSYPGILYSVKVTVILTKLSIRAKGLLEYFRKGIFLYF
jgi:hypothetical protein